MRPADTTTPSYAPSPGATTAVVVNGTASATGIGEEVLRDTLADLREHGTSARGYVTRTEDELHRVLAAETARRVVLVGGDGTLHAAVNAPVRPAELALIPAGRANNVAHALGVPVDPAKAAAVAANAPAVAIDLLRLDAGDSDRYCIEGVSAGLQADARARYSGANSSDLRGGVAALAGAIRDYHPYELRMSLDGEAQTPVEAAQLFFSNLPLFGFGFRVNPEADPSDGKLESILIRARNRRQAVRLLASSYRGTHIGRPQVSLRRARHATIAEPVPLVCDGTPMGVAPASVTVERGGLRIAAPWPR
jgi:diacylglycerol kinase (ATP)